MPEYRNLGNSGLLVSTLCLGAMNFGNDVYGCDEETSYQIIDAYLEGGHNFIDTANNYSDSRSEVILGKALKGRRDDVVVATKSSRDVGPGMFDAGTSRKAIVKAVEDSLRRLDTDYIDVYQMHGFDPDTPVEETLSTLNDLVRSGKVRYIGVSNWSASQITDAARLMQMHGWEPLISLQPQYSILFRDIEPEIVPTCLKFGLGIIPWSPLASGVLTGKYSGRSDLPQGSRLDVVPMFRGINAGRNVEIVGTVIAEAKRLGTTPAALSLAWNRGRPGVVAPIIGPKSVRQLEENLQALDLQVPPEVIERIDAVSAPYLPYPHNFGPPTAGRKARLGR
jgi:aryl-alcohol dehydrogenase-like predicted oxidoreductase